MNLQLERYFKWQDEAEKGLKYLPKNIVTPVKTAIDIYRWRMHTVRKDPFIIYKKRVNPSKGKIVMYGLKNLLLK